MFKLLESENWVLMIFFTCLNWVNNIKHKFVEIGLAQVWCEQEYVIFHFFFQMYEGRLEDS